jgi:lipopolysaccharide/colanic/teichoic acid biosynthesis glycosyltransferase
MMPKGKRLFDVAGSLLLLIFYGPLLLTVWAVIVVTSGRPAIFRQKRVGQYGRPFTLYKFRTMRPRASHGGPSFEPGDVSRVTPFGRLLRASKLDEWPQLWNVLKGDMSLVGPRPEVPEWVAIYPDKWEVILSVRPGLTDPASILCRDEEALLAGAADPVALYRDVILPRKLDIYRTYVRYHHIMEDGWIIAATIRALFRKSNGDGWVEAAAARPPAGGAILVEIPALPAPPPQA